MTSKNEAQDVRSLLLRSRRTLGRNGQESIASTLYCLAQERSVPVAECEACKRFHALHFEPASRATLVRCRCEKAAPAPTNVTALSHASGGPPDPVTPVADIMTKEVICVRADVDLQQVKRLLLERGISGVPVVDEQGKPIGIVSRADVLRFDFEQDDAPLDPDHGLREPARVTAGDIMTPIVLTLHENSNLGQAASLMAFEGVHRLPIVSDKGEVVGVLSALDVLRWFGRRSGYFIP